MGIGPELMVKLDSAIEELYRQRRDKILGLVRQTDAGEVIDCVCGHTAPLGEATLITARPEVDMTYAACALRAALRQRITVVCPKCAETYGGSWPLVVEFMASLKQAKGGDGEQVSSSRWQTDKEELG